MKIIGWSIILLCILTAQMLRAEVPPWMTDHTVKRIGANTVVVICEGKGLSRQLSYQEAMQSCSALAAEQKDSTIKVSQVVIESEREPVKLYSSVESDKQVTGLRGKTENELTSATEIGFITYLQVRYDLRDVIVTTEKSGIDDKTTVNAPLLVQPKEKSFKGIERKGLVTDATRSITVQLSDKCIDYLVRGRRPRSQSCGNSNVIQAMVNMDEDQEIIFRPADNHLLPVTIKVNRGRMPTSSDSEEVLDVVFPRTK